MHKTALGWYFNPYFAIFTINNQNTFSQLILCMVKFLVLIQTFSRTNIDLK